MATGLAVALPVALAVNLVVAVSVLHGSALAAGTAFLAAASLVATGMWRHYPHARIGACNVVTLIRLALTTALLAPLVAGEAGGWTVAAVASLSLMLDGLDGFLARRSGLVSSFGARFDMEVDAGLALVLALHALASGLVGAEVLVLGAMRYLFLGAGRIWPWIMAPLPESLARKTVCVLQLTALIALQIPQLSVDAAILVARVAAGAVIWSFGRDLLWLWRHR
ncbi:MAG: CDP-alcohol phosphatidyltransferase family protein [Alphaproteobacteria bacterium]|nr:CDP-alcohol phosphatidyltransferase family protein [Alphaproteobacteria bacterium]